MTHHRLTRDELKFLDEANIPLRCVADMRPRAAWVSCAEFMHPNKQYVAWGFRTCPKGHRISTAKGKCLQCDKSPLGRMFGYWTAGEVYLLHSEGSDLVKVGFTTERIARIAQLNAEPFAGYSDWKLMRSWWCEQPALLEQALKVALRAYKVDITYLKFGKPRRATEVFDCSRQRALAIWRKTTTMKDSW